MEHMATWRTAEILLGGEEFQAGGAVDTHFYGPTVCIFWVLDQIELNQSFEYGLSNNLLNSHVHEVKLVFLSQLFCTAHPALCSSHWTQRLAVISAGKAVSLSEQVPFYQSIYPSMIIECKRRLEGIECTHIYVPQLLFELYNLVVD